MTRKQVYRRDLPQLASSHQLDTNVVDTHYEQFDDDQYSHNNRAANRAYNAGRYARSAYNWGQKCSRGVTPAMENGAGAAIGTLGTVANHTNPFKPWRSFAFWSMSIGTCAIR